jgi:hypothetical protein
MEKSVLPMAGGGDFATIQPVGRLRQLAHRGIADDDQMITRFL